MNDVQRVSRTIYSNSRLEIEFFMYLPTGTFIGKEKTSIQLNYNPTIFIRYKKNQYVSEEYDYMKAAYKITPKNLYWVIDFFNEIMKWFYDDKYRDLFLVDNNEKLIFNADYKNLTLVTQKNDYDSQIMRAIPTIVSLGEKISEGAHIYINTTNYCVPLTYQEITTIFNLLKDISFTNEVCATLLTYQYVQSHNAYASASSYTTGTYKSPFN